MANKSTKVEILRRVEQVMKIILFGGEFSDIRQYSSEKDENTKRPRWGVCDRTLHTYQQQAYELIEQQVEKRRDRIFARHVQQRRQMLALAMEAGDLSTALQIVKDEAALHGIYPKTNVAVTLESVTMEVVEEIVDKRGPDTPGIFKRHDTNGSTANRAVESPAGVPQ